MRVGLAICVHLVVGRARADDGSNRLLRLEGRDERIRPRPWLSRSTATASPAHRDAGPGGNRDAGSTFPSRCTRFRYPTSPRPSPGWTPSTRQSICRRSGCLAVQRGPYARPPVVPTEVRRLAAQHRECAESRERLDHRFAELVQRIRGGKIGEPYIEALDPLGGQALEVAKSARPRRRRSVPAPSCQNAGCSPRGRCSDHYPSASNPIIC